MEERDLFELARLLRLECVFLDVFVKVVMAGALLTEACSLSLSLWLAAVLSSSSEPPTALSLAKGSSSLQSEPSLALA